MTDFGIPASESVKLLVKTAVEQGIVIKAQIANILAQCDHETGRFALGIEGNCASQASRLGYGGGAKYCGRGYIQLTHRNNYRKMGNLLGVDLENNPAKAIEPQIAALVATIGMRDGIFTGKKLSDYITETKQDYYNARAIVNGDKNYSYKNTSQTMGSWMTERSKFYLNQMDELIAGADPDLSGATRIGGEGNSGTGYTRGGGAFVGASIGVCEEQFPINFTLDEAITYPGCLSRETPNAMGTANSLSTPQNGEKTDGPNPTIPDFENNSTICEGCLGFPFKKAIRITSPFCQKRTSKSGRVYFHSGTDYGGFEGEEVVAVADGTVVNPTISGDGYNPGFVDIVHEGYGNLISRSGHIIPSVQPGTKVKQGDVIGKVGPYPSGGPHLHLELRKDKGAGGSVYSAEDCKTKLLDPALYCKMK